MSMPFYKAESSLSTNMRKNLDTTVVGHHAEHIAIKVDYNGRGF